jgi:hypothetical protein
VIPQAPLGVGAVPPQIARDGCQSLSGQRLTPSPNPLPDWERAFAGARQVHA